MLLNLSKGFWLDIDGIDGAGKTTLALNFLKFLSGLSDPIKMEFKKHPLLYTKEATYITKPGLKIREILGTQTDPVKDGDLLLDLYFEDRKIHQDGLILPSLEQGCIVINDRGELSSFTYQLEQFKKIGVNEEKAFINILNKSKKVQRSDLYIIVNTPAAVAIERMKAEGRGTQKFERDHGFLEGVRLNYLNIADRLIPLGYNIKIVDGTETPEKIFEESKVHFKQEYYNKR
jgi:dTMP kinase